MRSLASGGPRGERDVSGESVSPEVTAPMRFAYADPPYLGTSHFNAEHHYGAHHEAASDCDDLEVHKALIARLVDEFPDGWCMSLGTNTLRLILPECPDDVRICAWVKGWCSWKPGVHPKYAWEPVILRGGRKRKGVAVRDWWQGNIATNQPIPGSKPAGFNRWVLGLLGYEPGDELVDLFPGTGGMGRAVEGWTEQLAMDL